MKRLFVIAGVLLVVASGVYSQDCTGSQTIMKRIYHPERLIPTDKGCVKVSGIVIAKLPQDDGDIHYRLKLDTGQGSGLINKKNNAKRQHNFLIFEPICVGKIKDTPAAAKACRNFRQKFSLPNKGDRVEVTGIHMLDNQHKWLEIHPVTMIKILPR
jgi:hypothetical protein